MYVGDNRRHPLGTMATFLLYLVIGASLLSSQVSADFADGLNDEDFYRREYLDSAGANGYIGEDIEYVENLDEGRRTMAELDEEQQAMVELDEEQRTMTEFDEERRKMTELDEERRGMAELDEEQRNMAEFDEERRGMAELDEEQRNMAEFDDEQRDMSKRRTPETRPARYVRCKLPIKGVNLPKRCKKCSACKLEGLTKYAKYLCKRLARNRRTKRGDRGWDWYVSMWCGTECK